MPCKLCGQKGHNKLTCPTTLIYSIVDKLPCSGGSRTHLIACADIQHYGDCHCQECPICYERVPFLILECKPHTNYGIYMGPHCVQCDYRIWMTRYKQ